jgi:hypothetical protein
VQLEKEFFLAGLIKLLKLSPDQLLKLIQEVMQFQRGKV